MEKKGWILNWNWQQHITKSAAIFFQTSENYFQKTTTTVKQLLLQTSTESWGGCVSCCKGVEKRLTVQCHVQWCPSAAWWPHTVLEGLQGHWRTRWSPESWHCRDGLPAALEASVLLPQCSPQGDSPDLHKTTSSPHVAPSQSSRFPDALSLCPFLQFHRINNNGIITSRYNN